MVQTSYNSKPTIVFIASLGHYWAVNGFTITGSSLYANTVCSLSSLAVAGQRLLSASWAPPCRIPQEPQTQPC